MSLLRRGAGMPLLESLLAPAIRDFALLISASADDIFDVCQYEGVRKSLVRHSYKGP